MSAATLACFVLVVVVGGASGYPLCDTKCSHPVVTEESAMQMAAGETYGTSVLMAAE